MRTSPAALALFLLAAGCPARGGPPLPAPPASGPRTFDRPTSEPGTAGPPAPDAHAGDVRPAELATTDPSTAATVAVRTSAAATAGKAATADPCTAPNDPTKRPTANAPGCAADPHHCCQPGGKIVPVGYCSHGADPPDPAGCGRSGPRRLADGSCARCPPRKCLPAGTRIRTVAGERAVEALRVGDLVFTRNEGGRAEVVPVLALRALTAGGAHGLVRVTLDDGRSIAASAGHPTAGGVALDALAPGDPLDGARIVAIEGAPYEGATWDLLPAGPTGAYWADGVLLGTTLH